MRTGGLIPASEQLPLLLAARQAGVDLRPIDFFGMTELPPLGNSDGAKLVAAARGINDNPREKVA